MNLSSRILGLTGIIFLVTSGFAMATNGYFSHGYSAQSKAMAGVGAALPQDAMASANNPAGIAFIEPRYDINLALFSPNREHTVTGTPSGGMGTFGLNPGTVSSEKPLFFIPAFGGLWKTSNNSIGLAIYGNGGMNTSYDATVFHGTKPVGVDLSQLFALGTFAREIAPGHAIGIGGIFCYQWFEAEGLQAFGSFSQNSEALTNNGHDFSSGFGGRFGYMGQVAPGVRIGGSYQTKIFMSEFDEYAGLFAEQGDFDVPATWTAGIAINASPQITLAVDVQQILYSGVNSVSTAMDPSDFQQGILLGSDNGSGFGWEDMTVAKFGIKMDTNSDLILRGGYSYGKQPIPESEMLFNILAPGVMEHHITFGITKLLGSRSLTLAVMYAPVVMVSGPNKMEVPDQQEIELKMNQFEVVAGFSF
jgi:long-chain fatty acid transport protein